MEENNAGVKALELCGVCKRVRANTLLNNVSMDVMPGEVIGLRGRNASGKSILLKAVASLVTLTSGSIRIFGEDNGALGALRQIGALIEYPSFLPNFSGFRNLMNLARLRGKIGADDVKAAMECVGLDAADKRAFGSYSLGMRQRLGIACAVMQHPRLLLLDEPFSNLDTEGAREVKKMLQDLHNREGTTIVIASPEAEDFENMCSRVLTMAGGALTEG